MPSTRTRPVPLRGSRIEATWLSLIGRLADWGNQADWKTFFDTYWRLIYSVARKSGLTDEEAQDVVQETLVTVAKNITKYQKEGGSFKSWLLHTTRWRINDQFRKRPPGQAVHRRSDASGDETATIERIPSPAAGGELDAVWQEEWERNLFHTALERVKRKVSARQFQIFECCVVKRWSAARVSTELRVNIAQVYLAKHRVSSLMKKEVLALKESGPERELKRRS